MHFLFPHRAVTMQSKPKPANPALRYPRQNGAIKRIAPAITNDEAKPPSLAFLWKNGFDKVNHLGQEKHTS